MVGAEKPPDFVACELTVHGEDRAELRAAGGDYEGHPKLTQDFRRTLLQSELNPREYGTRLFAAVFVDDLLAGYRDAYRLAAARRQDLRFRLRISHRAPELHELHWELLYDPRRKVALGRSQHTPFSRHLNLPMSRSRPVIGKPRLLLVISAPENLDEYQLPKLDRRQVREEIEGALRALPSEVEWDVLEEPATPQQIRERLKAGEYQALHLLAHGTLLGGEETGARTASVLLETEERIARPVGEERFSQIFEGDPSLLLVTLIACQSGAMPRDEPFSGLAPALVAREIPAVVAMRRSITLRAAGAFTRFFYSELARKGLIDCAVNEARHQLYLADEHGPEWGTPALFMKLEDGRLWEPSPPPPDRRPRSRRKGTEVPWQALLDCIESDTLVPIVGPGVLQGLLSRPEEIAQQWAEEYHYPLNGRSRTSLPAVAQYLSVQPDLGRSFPHGRLPKDLLKDLLEREKVESRSTLKGLGLTQVIERLADRHLDRDEHEPHRILAELPLSTYLTTNYDGFLTAALKWVRRQPRRAHCAWRKRGENGPTAEEAEPGTEHPLVFHLYGHDEVVLEQVLTEDDYLEFLKAIAVDLAATTVTGDPATDRHLIPVPLRERLTESLLLFLGYRVRDLDCRVLFQGLIGGLPEALRPRVAFVQLDPEEESAEHDAVQHYLGQWCTDSVSVKAYWIPVRDFLQELGERWKERDAT